MNATFIFWDAETTGLDKAFHVPVEFGAVVTDPGLRPIDNINISCRPPRFVLPEPGALLTTRRSIGELQSRPLSVYNGTCQFAHKVRAVTPACFVGFNCLRFDHPLMQHCLYRNLIDPYVMVKGGNRRIDMMRLVQLAHALGLGGLVVPISDAGKTSFKLERIAPLNGFDEAGAHSALVDARAVHHLARLVAARAPETLGTGAVPMVAKGCRWRFTLPGPMSLSSSAGIGDAEFPRSRRYSQLA